MDTNQSKVLVIDDEPVASTAIKGMLESAGFLVEAVDGGLEGMHRLIDEPHAYSVVILDRIMPEMDGMAFLKQLKSHGGLKHLPVIMLTCVDDGEAIVGAVDAGVFDYLNKPVKKEHLVELVKLAVAQSV